MDALPRSPHDTAAARAPRRRLHAWLILAAATGAAHGLALRNGFVLDDHILLVDNPYVRTWSGLRELLRHELFLASSQPQMVPYYRPLSGLLNWVSFQLLGANAWLQHALNLGLHTGVVILLFFTLQRHLVDTTVAFGAALLFAVHPATAEVVAYLGGRQDLLGWAVGLGAILLLQRSRSLAAAGAVGLAATLAGALCHEFFLCLFVPLGIGIGCRGDGDPKAKGASVFVGGLGAVLGVFGLRSWLGLLDFETHFDGPVRLVQVSAGVLLRLCKDVLLPTDLAVNVTIVPPSVPSAVILVAASAGTAAWLVIAVERRRKAILGLSLSGISVVALSTGLHAGPVLKYGFMSDRYAYSWLVGFVMVAASLIEAFSHSLRDRAAERSRLAILAHRWGAYAIALAVIPLTWSRDTTWRDERSLQISMMTDRPFDPESRLALGMMFFGEGDIERAYPHCLAFSESRPSSEKANLCIGSWLLLHRQAAEAASYLRPYALSHPGTEVARRAFLAALVGSRQYDEASRTVEDWARTFVDAPDIVEARSALEARTGAQAAPPATAP